MELDKNTVELGMIRILFGSGVYAKKYKALLEYLHMDFDYFTDNDSSKWGTVLYGKKIISPEELKRYPRCQIIISSTHETAIRKQLSEMGLIQNIIGLNQLYQLCEQRMNDAADKKNVRQDEEIILVDMYEGIGWGGSELWAADLALGLNEIGKRVILIGGTEQAPLEERYEKLIRRLPEQNTIKWMIELMESNLPFVFINNFAGCGFIAAIILKRKYPDLVRIISVIHNDNQNLFDAHMMMEKYIDKIFCVSEQIRDRMWRQYHSDNQKYFFKEQPIQSDISWRRNWNTLQPLRVGYAARLVRQQKRADLLTDLIGDLEDKKVDYCFQIAGEGECLKKLKTYIRKNRLESKVQLLGRLPKSKMDDFWKNQDVFVNVSEYEGTSLSMLEAMSYGCVPVVTDVSGAREFIAKDSGYICQVGDMECIAECISRLAENRKRLKKYGQNCRKTIQNRCNPKEYIDYWIKNLLKI